MSSHTFASTVAVTQIDVLYVARNLNLDLQALSRAYPDKLPPLEAMSLFTSYTTFIQNYAISRLGFSIYDPDDSNLVYHEFRYEVLYGMDVVPYNPTGDQLGVYGQPVSRVWLPASACFTPWVVWSDHMRNLPVVQQEAIVSGTEWDIPARGRAFNARYVGGSWSSHGFCGRGPVGVNSSVWVVGSCS